MTTWVGRRLQRPARKPPIFSDFFRTNTVDTSKWDVFGTVSQAGDGLLTVLCTAGFSEVDSKATLNLKARTVSTGINTIPVGATCSTRLDCRAGSNDRVRFGVADTTIFSTIITGGSSDFQNYGPYTASTKFFRIRESGGTLYFELSADGSSWTTIRTAATPAYWTACQIFLVSGYTGAESDTPSKFSSIVVR